MEVIENHSPYSWYNSYKICVATLEKLFKICQIKILWILEIDFAQRLQNTNFSKNGTDEDPETLKRNYNASDNWDSFTSPEHARMFKFSKKIRPEVQRIDLTDPKRAMFISQSPFGEEQQSEMSNTPVSVRQKMTTLEFSDLQTPLSENDSKQLNFADSQTESQMDFSLHKKVSHFMF